MTAVNHALTGGVIAATLNSPWALPLAFASHFLLDALPHFGDAKRTPVGSKPFWIILGVDILLVLLLLATVATGTAAYNPWLVSGGMIIAASPDIVHLNMVLPRKLLPEGPLYKLHKQIQWSESPKGIVLEAVWLVGGAIMLAGRLYG